MILNTEPSGRIDTTITTVAAWGNDGASQALTARRYTLTKFPKANVLGVWRTGERNEYGWPVYAVEWEEPDSE